MKKNRQSIGRVLALDVRPQKFGFAVFEHPARLLDFGMTGFATPRAATLRLTSLLQASQPAFLALRRIPASSRRDCPRTRAIMRAIRRIARSSSVNLAWIGEKEIENFFRARGAHNKDQRAAFLALTYPQLAAKLPSPRRLWQSENWYMTAFDAVGLAVSYLASTGERVIAH